MSSDLPPGSPAPPDPVALTQSLVRRPSVTPEEGGALALLESVLTPFGFRCRRVDRGGVANLFARRGEGAPAFGFAGHTDVVPIGDPALWSVDPFGGEIRDGALWGRGATDMKSGVAAFVAAVCAEAAAGTLEKGSVALLITGDEEGPAEHGTRALLDWMAEAGERIDHCLVGEPTAAEALGDVMKIGRRGSLNAAIRVEGVAGHVAYPDRANNPLTALVRLLDGLAGARLDAGTAHFQPSTLALTSIDVGNAAANVIPAEARAALNIRFNDAQSCASLTAWLQDQCDRAAAESGVVFTLETRCSGEAFYTAPEGFADLVAEATFEETGRRPEMTTGGGTSDARFIKDHCPVVELGLTGTTMHQIDERAAIAEIEGLTAIYRRILRRYFSGA